MSVAYLPDPCVIEKLCKRCGVVRAIGLFNLDKRYRDGYQPWCKPCYAEYRKRPDQKVKQHERYKERYADPEYRAEYRDQQNTHTRKRWHTDPEYRRRKNTQNLASKKRDHRKPKIRLWSRVRAHHRRELMARAKRPLTTVEWETIRDHYGPKCLCCGQSRPLTIDHVLPLSLGGPHEAPNIQPLCRQCNIQKYTESTDYRSDSGAWILTWW